MNYPRSAACGRVDYGSGFSGAEVTWGRISETHRYECMLAVQLGVVDETPLVVKKLCELSPEEIQNRVSRSVKVFFWRLEKSSKRDELLELIDAGRYRVAAKQLKT